MLRWRGAAGAAVVAAGLYASPPTICGRLLRNIFCDDTPVAVAPHYAPCTDEELVAAVTIVATAKDRCTHATTFFAHLATAVPRAMRIIYMYPDFVGCRDVDPRVHLFPRLTVHRMATDASPIAGFLLARALMETPYALLLHNDAYLMEPPCACELIRALQAHPDAAFAAPQLYERGANGVAVPHGHHRNLHLQRTEAGDVGIAYDIDFELLTQRRAVDFHPGGYAQRDFMEDHAYMGRTATYHLYLDERASFTMEYLDSILAMRANGSYAWAVPTARVIFDVDTHKLGWRDIPYFVHKRSEEVGLQVRAYLSDKWGVAFPNTGIWNYVRHVFLSEAVFTDNALPADWSNQRALYLSWFHSIGFNRYDGATFLEALAADNGDGGDDEHLRVSRVPPYLTARGAPTGVHASARSFLPRDDGRRLIQVALANRTMPIALRLTTECQPERCGLLVIDHGGCHCFTYLPPYAAARDYGAIAVLDLLKLPSRIFRFVQMKYAAATPRGASWQCAADEAACVAVVPAFAKTARIVKWGWAP